MLPKIERKKAIWISLSWVSLISLAVVFFDLAQFKTNDDFGMMYRIRGLWIAHQPVTEILFSHIDVSRFLIHLYQLAPEIPWYGLYLLLPICIVHYLISYYGMRKHGLRGLVYVAAYMVSGGYLLFLELQFTISSAAWTGSGLILLIQQIRKDRWVWPTWVGVLFVLLGIMVRFKQAVIIFICFLPLVFFFSINYRSQRRIQRGAILFLLVSLLSVLIQYRQVSAYRETNEREALLAYNKVRGELHDFKAFEALSADQQASTLREIGWSPNDYRLFNRLFFWDQEVYSLDALQQILDQAPTVRRRLTLKSLIKYASKIFYPYSIAVLIVCLWIYFESRRMRREHWLLAYGIATILSLYLLSAAILKPIPDRVGYGLFLSLMASSILFIRPRPSRRKVSRSWLFSGIVIILAMACGIQQVIQYKKFKEQKKALIKYNDYMELHPKATAVIWGSYFPYSGITPFQSKDSEPRGKAILLGSLQQAQSTRDHAKYLGLEPFYERMLDDDVLLIVRSDLWAAEEQSWLETYYLEHYNERTEWSNELELGPLKLLNGRPLNQGQ